MAARRVGAAAQEEARVSEKEERELHHRTITFDVARGDDGRASARGELVDVRRIGMGRHLGKEHPPGVVHHMGLEVEIDAGGTVETANAWMKTAPFEPSPRTAGEACRHILPNYQRLVGARLDDAYAARVLADVGGVHGCFHILSLAQCLPFAVLASRGTRARRELDLRAVANGGPGFRLDGELVDYEDGGAAVASRLRLDLEFPGFRIAGADGDGAEAASAAALAGLTIARGFTAAALERLNGARRMIALVVALTPITAQASGSYAALLGYDLRARSRARAANPQIDSCHMWRSDGPLVALAASETRDRETP